MDSTDPKQTGEAPPKTEDLESEVQQGETPETRTVPKQALDEARVKLKTERERAARLEAELAEARAARDPVTPATGKTPKDIGKSVGEETIKRLEQIEERERRRELVADLGVSHEQAAQVQKILQGNPDLTAKEALTIARVREPDAFPAEGQRGFDPSMHGTLRPTIGSPQQPPPSDTDKWREHIANIGKLPDVASRERELNRLAGHSLKKAMGLPSELKPVSNDPLLPR